MKLFSHILAFPSYFLIKENGILEIFLLILKSSATASDQLSSSPLWERLPYLQLLSQSAPTSPKKIIKYVYA